MTEKKPTDSQPSADEPNASGRRSTHTWHFVYQTWKRGTQASDEDSRPDAIKVEPTEPAMKRTEPTAVPPSPPQASPSQPSPTPPESVIANLVTSGTKGGTIAASAPRSDRRFGISAIAAALLLGIGLIAALEYFSNARLRASVETALNSSQATNSALGQLRTELDAVRVSLDQSSRRGDNPARLHETSEALAGLQRRLGEIETAHGGAVERLGQRLDAGESRQGQASQKLVGLADSLSQVESRQTETNQKLAALADRMSQVESRMSASIASPDRSTTATASSSAQKQNDRPPSVDGWRVVDVAGQRAIVRNPTGRLYEVASGSEVPGLGTVEHVRRVGKRVTVVTPQGVITAVLGGSQ